MAVELVNWNPRRPALSSRLGRRVPIRRRVNNFGDLLGPIIVRELLRRAGLRNSGTGRLLTVGSILHLSHPGDTIWGSGVNGKLPNPLGGAPQLDVRAVRGPETRRRLLESGMSHVPAVYGDPGLLWGRLWPREQYLNAAPERFDVTIVPNFNDWSGFADNRDAIDPRRDINVVISRIARSRLVVGSSLHGIILAESFGIPARMVAGEAEHPLKYVDYYRGTGRHGNRAADSVCEAIKLGGEAPPLWDPDALLAAFPFDIFHRGDRAHNVQIRPTR